MKKFRIRAALVALAALAFASAADAQLIVTGPNEPNFVNLLDNGTFNTYQRGTAAVTGITNSATYHADRWAGFGGASSSITLTNVTSSLPTGFTNAERLQRASANANTATIHLVQEIPTADVTGIQGQPVNLSCWAKAEANLSASGSAITASVGTGTGTDEGLTTYISGFTGAATPVTGTWTLTTSWQRFSLTGTLGTTATEAVVDLNYTPVGTAGTTDAFDVTGCELARGTATPNFEWRPLGIELVKLYRYYYQINEGVAGADPIGWCYAYATSYAKCAIPLPEPMRVQPTVTITTGTFEYDSTTPVAWTGPVQLGGVNSNTTAEIFLSTTNTPTCSSTTALSVTACVANLLGGGGTGKIKISADF